MTYATALPAPPATGAQAQAADASLVQFGASARLIGGQPDARYFWLDRPDGPCIVKQMDADLAAYNPTLLAHEREALAQLAQLDAPVPELLDLGRADWLVTRFAGLSMRVLQCSNILGAGPALQRFPLAERFSVWVHLLRRLQPLADAGVLVVDLHEGNVVVPMTSITHGQLRLTEPGLIDQAHTLRAGMNLSRPVWLAADGNPHIPPELREVLKRDQDAQCQDFEQRGADLPGYSRVPTPRDARNRQVWAEYRRPQHLQQLVDSAQVSCDAAMQYAVGAALASLLPLAGTDVSPALQTVVQRMLAAKPADRFGSLSDAADALAQVHGRLPLVSAHHYPQIRPHDLLAPAAATPSPSGAGVAGAAHAGMDGTVLGGQACASAGLGMTTLPGSPAGRPAGTSTLPPAAGPAKDFIDVPHRDVGSDRWMWWFGAAVAAGTAAGMLLPW